MMKRKRNQKDELRNKYVKELIFEIAIRQANNRKLIKKQLNHSL